MLEFLLSRGFMPHGFCMQWRPELLNLHVWSDVAIALAYFSIPAMIIYYLRRRTAIADIPFVYLMIGAMFACFIVFCGLSHVMGLITIWKPWYGAHGVVKAATGAISVATALMLIPILPRALALRTPEELEAINQSLQEALARGEERERELARKNKDLKDQIVARTAAEASEQAAIQARDELQQALDQLKLTQARLLESEKLASVGKSMAGIAHEVNTPVGVAITAVSVLQDATMDTNTAFERNELSQQGLNRYLGIAGESLDIVSRNLDRAASLLQSVKQVATDQSSDQPRQITMREYVEMVLRSLKPKVIASPHRVNLQCPNDLVVTTIPGALSQVIINLVANAMQHAYPDGREGDIHLDINAHGDGFELICTDHGIGIPTDILPHIYEPFFTTQKGQGGSGIGLDIVRMLVTEKLGGVIDVESKPGEGTRFTVRVPDLASRQQPGDNDA